MPALRRNRQTEQQTEQQTEEPQPSERDQRSAEVSEEACCLLADIDELLADASESDIDRARRERNEIMDRYWRAPSDSPEEQRADRDYAAWKVQYAHLSDELGNGCTC